VGQQEHLAAVAVEVRVRASVLVAAADLIQVAEQQMGSLLLHLLMDQVVAAAKLLVQVQTPAAQVARLNSGFTMSRDVHNHARPIQRY
jgi:hypothetical protein